MHTLKPLVNHIDSHIEVIALALCKLLIANRFLPVSLNFNCTASLPKNKISLRHFY